ncbi:MAG TPA: PASTA domain-containing protein [Terriglobales bacterium]|jgi:beta-lactam-binding protein with PASTA domain|nr:PASTA domain-containing protein [Terriglobales bacterium]
MRGFFRFLLLGLVLIMVALVSGLTAMRIAIHGREVVVPKFVGLTPPQADRLAAQNGLLVEFESRFYSPDIPIGHILSQEPYAGEKVRRGWRVRLAESLGPQHVEIPDVVGQSGRAAEINLRRRGLEPGTVAIAHIPGGEDQVIAQAPPPAAKGVASPKVNLLFAAQAEPQAFVMPNLVGRHLSDATRAITEAGLHVGSVHIAPEDPATIASATDIVSKQSPTAGQKVLAGSAVQLEVQK